MEKQANGSLKAGCLNFTEVTAIAIALISPTMTGALIIPLMYSNAGNASWLAYLFGTVMLLFVALNLNQFARRSTSTGSMYAYTVMGLGATAGGMSAWCLVWAYLFDGIGGITGATIFANALLGMIGLHVPNLLLFAVLCAIVWFLAYEDIRVSSILMLVFETVSVSLTLVLAMAVLHRHNFALDTAQITLKGASFSGVALGVNIALFSMVGFESASAFGEEAKDPLVTIPRALIVSLLLTGLFFVIISYTEVIGFVGYHTPLARAEAPLNILANLMNMPYLKIPLSAGAAVSSFSAALSCLNAGARILYPMGRHGILHSALGAAHATNETPHVAVTILGALLFLIPAAMLWLPGTRVLDIFNCAGTLCAFGFLGAYALISVSAPAYLARMGIVRGRDFWIAVASLGLLLFPAVGSVYPVPSWPVNTYPYIFSAYLALGMVWIVVLHRGTPGLAGDVRRRVYMDHGHDVPAADTPPAQRRGGIKR
jgi:amino acid transporter